MPEHTHHLNAHRHSSAEASTLAEGAMLVSAYIKSGSKDINPSSELNNIYADSIGDDATFKLPDLRNRFLIGVDNNRYHLGDYVGSEYFQISPQAMPSHKHLLYAQTSKSTESKGTENMLTSVKKIEIEIGGEFKTCSIPYYSKKHENLDFVSMGDSMLQNAGQSKAIKHMPPIFGTAPYYL